MSKQNSYFITIGTGQFGGTGKAYKLIWDRFISVVWLDYTNESNTWTNQDKWASGLNSNLICDINPEYSVDWGGSSWRLPWAYDETYVNRHGNEVARPYYTFASEMGHLYYTMLGNIGKQTEVSGPIHDGYGLVNTSEFENLHEYRYWSGVPYEHKEDLWYTFHMKYGRQSKDGYDESNYETTSNYGLAVRDGKVIEISGSGPPSAVTGVGIVD